MHWQDTPQWEGINFGSSFGVPNSPTLFRVCVLRVPDGEPDAPRATVTGIDTQQIRRKPVLGGRDACL